MAVLLLQTLQQFYLHHQQAATDVRLAVLQRAAVSAVHQAVADYLSTTEQTSQVALEPVGRIPVVWQSLECPAWEEPVLQCWKITATPDWQDLQVQHAARLAFTPAEAWWW